ncbi:MAG: DUF1475 family protein [Thiotrichales bacterium]|nr:DUF1475 family protein [Thiotrichales bacterium]MCY4285515.1 DUF1475 family protein [Thiotrichales bacterium]
MNTPGKRPADRGEDESAPNTGGRGERATAGRRHGFPVTAVTGLGAGITLLMGGALVHGVTGGDFFEEGALLLALAWGRVALIDVYAGFALFAAWVLFREPHAVVAGAWIVALCLLGNVVAGCYVVLAARHCRGSAARFWLGAHRAGRETA